MFCNFLQFSIFLPNPVDGANPENISCYLDELWSLWYNNTRIITRSLVYVKRIKQKERHVVMQNSQRKRRRRKSVDWFVGRLAIVLCVFVAFIFAVSVISTGLLPTKFLVVLVVILLLATVLVGLLTWNSRYRVRYIIGLILALVLCVLYVVGTVYISKTMSTAKTITTVKTETAAVGIYVRADDPNDYAQVAGSYTYGILAEQDRENTDEAIAQISEEYGVTLSTKTYDGLPMLIDGLFASEVDAIIVNSAYIGLLEELEGYEDAASKIREVKITHVEREVEVVQTAPDPEEVPEDRLVGVIDEEEVGQDGMTFTVFISGIDTRHART